MPVNYAGVKIVNFFNKIKSPGTIMAKIRRSKKGDVLEETEDKDEENQ